MPHSLGEMIARSSFYVIRNLPEVWRREPSPVSYDMLFKDSRDGCARYDDVWGG